LFQNGAGKRKIDKMSQKPKIIVICGPTGIGKTATAIALAEIFNGEIVGADSMQIYRHMDIGTAKPTSEEQSRVRHHMIDIVDPDEHFDAKMFAKMAREKIAQLHSRNVLPIVAGGTGFYVKALLYGLFHSDPVNMTVRNRLKQEAAEKGNDFLFQRLSRNDPQAAEKLHPNDIYRIIRAIEVYEATGKTLSEYHQSHQFGDNPFDALKIGLGMDRQLLYERINRRVDLMLGAGLLEEVGSLLDRGYSASLKSMQSIGYRHMSDFIQGRLSWEEAVRTLGRDTRRYAKRQFTWFRADSEVIWTEPSQIEAISGLVRRHLD